jgi:hypothetical protein
MEYWSVGALEKSLIRSIKFVNPILHYSSTPFFLDVACQAVVGHFLSGVTVHTPGHRHLHPRAGRRFFALADIPVALLALEFPQGDMAAVREEDMIRLPVKASPGDLLPSFVKLPDFFLLSALREGFFVTFQTGRSGRHSGEGLIFIVRVTGQALNALLLMLFVIEEDGLPRSSADPETKEEEEETKAQS